MGLRWRKRLAAGIGKEKADGPHLDHWGVNKCLAGEGAHCGLQNFSQELGLYGLP